MKSHNPVSFKVWKLSGWSISATCFDMAAISSCCTQLFYLGTQYARCLLFRMGSFYKRANLVRLGNLMHEILVLFRLNHSIIMKGFSVLFTAKFYKSVFFSLFCDYFFPFSHCFPIHKASIRSNNDIADVVFNKSSECCNAVRKSW